MWWWLGCPRRAATNTSSPPPVRIRPVARNVSLLQGAAAGAVTQRRQPRGAGTRITTATSKALRGKTGQQDSRVQL